MSLAKRSVTHKIQCTLTNRKMLEISSKPSIDTNKNMILNDECLNTILSYMDLKNMLRLESVSEQFAHCVQSVLLNQTKLHFVNDDHCNRIIGHSNGNHCECISIKTIGTHFNDTNKSLIKLLEKCVNIKTIVFSNNVRISAKMVEWIANKCPKLESISITDYRCNYLTIDWNGMFSKLSHKLLKLEIEARTDQQIYNKDFAELILNLPLLQELAIISPRRRLDEVFANLGPNIRKLSILYSFGLDLMEVIALVNGNGKHLKRLDVQYESAINQKKDQNIVFQLICVKLTHLTVFNFNYLTLNSESIQSLISSENIRHFGYKSNGFDKPYASFEIMQSPQTKPLQFLRSLRLVNVKLPKKIQFDLLFPNIEKLSLKPQFVCNCMNEYYCKCSQTFVQSLSKLSKLRYLSIENNLNRNIIEGIKHLKQLSRIILNIRLIRNNDIDLLLNNLEILAEQRTNFELNVLLYGCIVPKITQLSFAKNLKIKNE